MPSRLAFRRVTPGTHIATACGVTYQVIGHGPFRAYRVTENGTADGGLHPAAEGGEKPTRNSAFAQCEADLEAVLADRGPAADASPVTDEQLAAVPLEHRRTVARWLTERAGQFEPSFLAGAAITAVIREAFQGAAVDLTTPGVDDSTIGHARAVLGDLAGPDAAPGRDFNSDGYSWEAPAALPRAKPRHPNNIFDGDETPPPVLGVRCLVATEHPFGCCCGWDPQT